MQFYLGTWQVAPSDGFWTGQDIGTSEKVISLAARLGIRGFDTAQSYGRGQAEQTLSKILRHFDQSFLIDTKIMPSTRDVSELVRASVSRLGPLAIDCLYLHWPRTGYDTRTFIKQADALKKSGVIRKTGLCNLPLSDLRALVSEGFHVDRIQRPASLLWTRELDETLSFCRDSGIGIAVYSPTGMGLLSGKYRSPEDLSDARKNLFCFDSECRPAFLKLLDLVSDVAKNNGMSCTKVALSWVISKNPDIVLIGARNSAQLEENLCKPSVLSSSELSDLTEAASELDRCASKVNNIFSYDW